MIWIVWRQHRTAIALTTVLAIALVGLVIAQRQGGVFHGDAWYLDYIPVDSLVPYAPSVLGVAVAVFWAAPLVSREYENRTYVVVWGQDVSPRRWLASTVVLLAVVAVALSAVVAFVTDSDIYQASTLKKGVFEADPVLQAIYTLFGFALGLAFSALLRRTLPAMAATLVVFLAVRAVVAWAVLDRILPPIRSFRGWSQPGQQVPRDAWRVDSGYADASGAPISISSPDSIECANTGSQTECLKGKGVAGHFADYHPHSRLPWFYMLEIGIYAVLTAVLFFLVFRWISKISGKSFHRPLASDYTA
nr:hypothetical protein [Kibdelosporangium sp. MJ126-NF4]CEL23143.1 putative transmembrane transport protein [Kibdelosporangium sp. MJ126-NF4]CTQ90281.1 putative transmembrane transport protein [Kibdelosporangium sp. MJ126-NF4]